MRNRGFSLVTVVVLSSIVVMLVMAGLYISQISFMNTTSEATYYRAQKAADACLLAAVDRVNSTGFCGNQTLTNSDLGINLNGSSCQVSFYQSTRICFLDATGTYNNINVYENSIIQAFYGVGLYTVRGGVNATYNGGFLSGCDYTSTSNSCFVPAFIASSGNVNLNGINPQFCPSSGSQENSYGIYGNPPIYTNAPFSDLVPLFFNVNCFGSNFFDSIDSCNYGLTDALTTTYAIPYDGSPDFTFDSYGQPIINQNLLNFLYQLPNITQSGPNCQYTVSSQSNLNLSNLSFLPPTISPSSCNTLTLYITNTNSVYGTPSIPITIYANAPLNLNGISGNILGVNNYGENQYNLYIYSIAPINISNGFQNARILTTNQVNDVDGSNITNATIIQALQTSNQNNNPNSPQNFIVQNGQGSLQITNSKVITRQIRFENLYAYRDLAYLYANACPACSRASSNSSINACYNDGRRCAWADGVGQNYYLQNSAYFGIDPNGNIQSANGNPLVSLLINNNSVVAAYSNNFGGIYFGQDVNYIYGSNATVEGFLVRNFPPNLSLNIGFNPSTYFQFNLNAINSLAYNSNRPNFPGFWFVKTVDCLKEPPTPAYMSVLTKMIVW
ncbi:MAG: hypothetical protein QXU98_09770 [Candidatus Parvarchaeota archaeon]